MVTVIVVVEMEVVVANEVFVAVLCGSLASSFGDNRGGCENVEKYCLNNFNF